MNKDLMFLSPGTYYKIPNDKRDNILLISNEILPENKNYFKKTYRSIK